MNDAADEFEQILMQGCSAMPHEGYEMGWWCGGYTRAGTHTLARMQVRKHSRTHARTCMHMHMHACTCTRMNIRKNARHLPVDIVLVYVAMAHTVMATNAGHSAATTLARCRLLRSP